MKSRLIEVALPLDAIGMMRACTVVAAGKSGPSGEPVDGHRATAVRDGRFGVRPISASPA